MKIYTIGFTQKSAKTFFEAIKDNNIEILIDVRLNNKSQLAGFAKGKDLEFFLKEICDCKYKHEEKFAPTKDLLDDYKKGKIFWEEYEFLYKRLLNSRDALQIFIEKYKNYNSICLLCSEHTPEQCHRRILAEYIKSHCPDTDDIELIHI